MIQMLEEGDTECAPAVIGKDCRVQVQSVEQSEKEKKWKCNLIFNDCYSLVQQQKKDQLWLHIHHSPLEEEEGRRETRQRDLQLVH